MLNGSRCGWLAGHEVGQGDLPLPVEDHRGIQGQQSRRHVGEAEPGVDRAAHGGAVAELDAHDVLHAAAQDAAEAAGELRRRLQLPLGDAGADLHTAVPDLDPVQPQLSEVNGGAQAPPAHLQPAAAAQNGVVLRVPAEELIGRLQGLGEHVAFDGVQIHPSKIMPQNGLCHPAAPARWRAPPAGSHPRGDLFRIDYSGSGRICIAWNPFSEKSLLCTKAVRF